MNLKKIPREPIHFTIHKISDIASSLKVRVISKAKTIQIKLAEEGQKHDDLCIVRTCLHLINFIEKEKQYGKKELDDLIDKMRRLIILLQRRQ